MSDSSTLPTLAIVGPTGSGKSSVAFALAKQLGGEIISCDSVQVYRGFDVGSAKATLAEQKEVPHHLVDVADWQETYDSQRFREDTTRLISEIRTRGHHPILCGGTGLYFRVLRWGVIDVPAADAAFRSEWEEREAQEPGVVVRRLQEVDPESVAAIAKNNVRHQIRALEIFEMTGKKASVVKREHGFKDEEVSMLAFWLQWPAEQLRLRIRERVDLMLGQGFVDEVRRLLDQGVEPDCQAMRAVGYREVVQYIQGAFDEPELSERIWKSTWAYARRQRTWLRKEKKLTGLEVTTLENTVELIQSQLKS
ncbi:MAG: tRNA (adenosine(37)-N6)-dimethylallyltransferase MiaA [Deltaproteobacteria bacterium]|nr:tRNA (adenosine(37)-N6)-dimethylallyltransferase MiaA [Deltaproteobacteria bacterium]